MGVKIDLFSFLQRKKLNQADLARAVETTPGNVNRWAKREGVPSYELCEKLLVLGMSVKELFGEDADKAVRSFYMNEQDASAFRGLIYDEEFQEGLRKSIDAKISSVMEPHVEYVLKKKGLIK